MKRSVFVVIAIAALGAFACSLNPQPYPPTSAAGDDDGGFRSDAGADAGTPAPDDAGGNADANRDAAVVSPDGGTVDASTDAGADGGDAGGGDAGDASDGALDAQGD